MENCPPKSNTSISRPSSRQSVSHGSKNEDITISQAFLQAVNDVSRKDINFKAVDRYMQEKFGYGNLKSSLSSLKLVTRSRQEYDVSGLNTRRIKSEIMIPGKASSKLALKRFAAAKIPITVIRPKNTSSKKPRKSVALKKFVPHSKKSAKVTKSKVKNAPLKTAPVAGSTAKTSHMEFVKSKKRKWE